MLKKPMEAIGETLNVPGDFWDKCPAADKERLYKCVLRDYTTAHKFTVGPPSAAFQMQEMGERGSGSLEAGDSSGEVFWMPAPEPFLKYYYQTFPEKLPAPTATATGEPTTGTDEQPQGEVKKEKVSKSMLYDFVTLTSDKLVTAGRYSGFHEWNYKCIIDLGGCVCGSTFTLRAAEGMAPNTGNISRHLVNFAERCPNHLAAYDKFLGTSKNSAQDKDGHWVTIFGFEDAFPHHVAFMWMHAEGLVSANMPRRESFREFIRGYEPRAAFPHRVTLHRLAEVIEDEQREERRGRLKRYAASFKGFECIGLQMDMWTDTETHVAYAALNATTLIEPDEHPTPLALATKCETPRANPSPVTAGSSKDAISSSKGQASQRPPQLELQSEVVAFEVFPFTEHTGANIAAWLVRTLDEEGITKPAVSGVSPDGAADGQCAMASIEDLGEKTDTCDLHRLQRAVLKALGLSGATSANPEAKAVLRKNGRVVTLSIQSRAVSDGIRNSQVEQDIPPHLILRTIATATTRWGNQKKQLSRNAVLRPVLDAVIDKYKRENRSNKEAIVESNESEQGSKVGKAVAASEMGLSSDDWEKTMELEAFVDQPFAIKEVIEHGSKAGLVAGPVTGAQSLMMMADLIKTCEPEAPLAVSLCPPTAALKDRERVVEERPGSQLSTMIDTGRDTLKDELESRFFIARPSNTRLVQCYLSKQKPIENYMPPRMCTIAETLYKQWIRRAASIAGISIRSSPPRAKKAKVGGGVFRAAAPSPAVSLGESAGALEFDTVTDEMQRWKDLSCNRIEPFTDEQGLINEFALMWNLRESFPLHYIVFKQTATHIPHEANVEQVFSLAGRLADVHRDPSHLSRMVMIARNKSVFKPEVKKLLSRYFQKFSKAGELVFEESNLGLETDKAQECDEE